MNGGFASRTLSTMDISNAISTREMDVALPERVSPPETNSALQHTSVGWAPLAYRLRSRQVSRSDDSRTYRTRPCRLRPQAPSWRHMQINNRSML
jgi:hypothetical protein